MRILARKVPYATLTDARMEKPEPLKISGGLQLMIALEAIPYFTTVVITSVLVSHVLDHPELGWSDVFAWRCTAFAGFTFMILSLANYGDRVTNGRFYMFLLFSGFSGVCMVSAFFAQAQVAVLVFACCVQPVLIVRDASRLCYIVQILRAREWSSKVRTLCFFMFLMANLGALFRSAVFSGSTDDSTTKIWGCIGSLCVYTLLSSLVSMFGGSAVAHRNIVGRGFKCMVWKFENLMRAIMRQICSTCCRNRLQDKEYVSLVGQEIVTCVDCMLKMSATLFPLLLYFATVEMTFFTWVRDYDIFVDLGFQDWPVSLADVYHGFNVASVLAVYVIVIPMVQCFVHVPDVVILCLSYFALCLSWLTAASLQYSNEHGQSHYSGGNETKIIVFSTAFYPVLLDVNWSDKKWLTSGDFSVNYLHQNSTGSGLVLSKASIWQGNATLPPAADSFPESEAQLVSNPSFLISMNKTECHLLVEEAGAILNKALQRLNRAIEGRAELRDSLNATLVTLCSSTLYATRTEHYLVIQDLQTGKFQTEQVCNSSKYDAITNLTVGWYILQLRQADQFLSFQMQVNVKRGAVHYLYFNKGNDTFAPYTGNFSIIIEPFFQIDKMYIVLQIGLFSFAYSMGLVALHSFVVGATPKHLMEFGFAIMFTSRAVGSGLAGVCLPWVTPNSQGMFTWVVVMVAGLLLMVRSAWVYLETGGRCGPEVKFAKEESGSESSEPNEEEEVIPASSKIDSDKFPAQTRQEPEPEPAQEPPTSTSSKYKPGGWFSRHKSKSPSVKGSPPPQPPPPNVPTTSKRSGVEVEPSEKLESVASWFFKHPKQAPNSPPSQGNQQASASTPAEPEYDSSHRNESKNKE